MHSFFDFMPEFVNFEKYDLPYNVIRVCLK
jgi:hypothetical protein